MDEYTSAVQAAAERTNQFNAEQAAINRNWQAMMSSSAHQREIADLKAAGLNPVLSANSGASAPSGATASGADSSGAIAGLLGQIINAQSAQAIAERNIASAKLLEEMRENHDIFMKQNYPNNFWNAVGSVSEGMDNFLSRLSEVLSRRTANSGSNLGASARSFLNWYKTINRHQSSWYPSGRRTSVSGDAIPIT